MPLTMTAEHTKQLLFLAEQSSQVLQDFCKLAADYLQKGPNLKIYGAASHKLSVEPEVIRSCVEGLINLLLESGKRRSSVQEFREFAASLGFDEEKVPLLCRLYEIERHEIAKALSDVGPKLARYNNIEWRFQVEIASRSLLNRLTPLFAIDLTLDKGDNSEDEVQHFFMQVDPTNLLHLAQQLESAVREARSQHTRRIKRIVKL